jgi:enoyl-CoA hydratase/carnithine racemase
MPQTAHEVMVTARRHGGTDAAAAGIVDRAVAEDAVRSTDRRDRRGAGEQGRRHPRHHHVARVRPGPGRPARHTPPPRSADRRSRTVPRGAAARSRPRPPSAVPKSPWRRTFAEQGEPVTNRVIHAHAP